MKNTDIAKIRQLITEIKDEFQLSEWGHYPAKAATLLEKILALLPCETCGGTGKKPRPEGERQQYRRP